MTFIKKNIKAIVFIIVLLSINTYLWVSAIQSAFLNSGALWTSLSGSTIVLGYSLVFLLSTRNKLIVKLFGGLEEVYFWHRTLSILSTALIFLHGFVSIRNLVSYQTTFFLLGSAAGAGELARNMFIFFIAVALLAKFIKYEHFRFIHRILVIPFVFALYHSFFSSWVNLFSFSTISIWMLFVASVGLVSAIYMLLIYQISAFKYQGIVEEKKSLNESTFELTVKLSKDYRFKPGQFAFIKIYGKGISKAAHPFSISSGNGNEIKFTIKSLGDFTESLKTSLQTPTRIKITRPFGNMTFNTKKEKQIWIAGGIGVTPFLGYVRSAMKEDKKIHMIYSVREEKEAVNLNEIIEATKDLKNFEFTLFDASKRGFLTASKLDLDENTCVYMCGPRPMAMALSKQIKEASPKTELEFEAFSFTGTLVEDILKILKKWYKKLKTQKA